ncbi:MAG: hypothetical protein JRI23_25955 [Deltaproteobacteria bacterium]|jgi:hypothetical protein|nr:hypothetical protein [Deltaproteobacteria bacterium]MBW2535473.1 hypothetical protein [Deltaproteobacteria bacterium]
MLPSGVYQIDRYVPTGSGHWAAKLDPLRGESTIEEAEISGTTLWSPYFDEGEEGLQRALLHPANAHLLRLLADRPDARLDCRMRAIGTAADVDVMAVLEDPETGRRTLLLVDCEPVGATKPSRLRAQYVRSLRAARALASNLCFGEPQPSLSLVVLAAWRPGIDRPTVTHRPAWRGDELVRPAVWGYLPFRCGETEYAMFGRWVHLDANRWARQVEARCRSWLATELKTLAASSRPLRRIDFRLDLGKGSGLVFLLDRGPLRARLQVPSPKHRRAMLSEGREDYQVRRIRSLREAAYGSHWAPTGWSFLGETVEDGSPWLHWQWTPADAPTRVDWGTAASEAERFAITMKMFIAGT